MSARLRVILLAFAAVILVALACGNYFRWTSSRRLDDAHEVHELDRIQRLIREKQAAQVSGDAGREADLSAELRHAIDDLAAYHKAHR